MLCADLLYTHSWDTVNVTYRSFLKNCCFFYILKCLVSPEQSCSPTDSLSSSTAPQIHHRVRSCSGSEACAWVRATADAAAAGPLLAFAFYSQTAHLCLLDVTHTEGARDIYPSRAFPQWFTCNQSEWCSSPAVCLCHCLLESLWASVWSRFDWSHSSCMSMLTGYG